MTDIHPANRALDPFWFRFIAPDDTAKYGTDWYCVDESEILNLPARQLLALEDAMDMRVVDVLNEFRRSRVIGELATAWMAVRAQDEKLAGPFNEFDPRILQIEWTMVEPEEVGKADAVQTGEYEISGPTATVVLDNMPVVGSGF